MPKLFSMLISDLSCLMFMHAYSSSECLMFMHAYMHAQSAMPRPSLATDYFNCLTKTAVQAIIVIACIVLSTDNSPHFIFFCFGMSQIKNRLPVDVTSFVKFLSVSGLVVKEGLGSAVTK